MNNDTLKKLLPSLDTSFEIKIIKDDILPQKTMIVSPDLYKILKELPIKEQK